MVNWLLKPHPENPKSPDRTLTINMPGNMLLARRHGISGFCQLRIPCKVQCEKDPYAVSGVSGYILEF